MLRRKAFDWMPLWIDKWLLGSTRQELEPAERAVWIDLLALASKDDGWIRANEEMSYPARTLAGIFMLPEELLETTVKKCIKAGKLERFDDGIMRIINWSKYQLTDRRKRDLSPKKKPKRKSRVEFLKEMNSKIQQDQDLKENSDRDKE